jgi:hypothetical protein
MNRLINYCHSFGSPTFTDDSEVESECLEDEEEVEEDIQEEVESLTSDQIAIETGKTIAANVNSESSIKNYSSTLRTFSKWIVSRGYQIQSNGFPKLPISLEMIQIYLVWKVEPKTLENGDISKPKSVSTASGIINAIKYLYRLNKLTMDFELCDYLNKFLCGYKLRVKTYETESSEDIQHGKSHLTLTAYKSVCEKVLSTSESSHSSHAMIYNHCFVIFCWNTAARCNSTAYLKFNQVSFCTSYVTSCCYSI